MMTIARMTWIEILRKKVLLMTLLMTVVFLGLYMFAVHSMVQSLAQRPPGDALGFLNNYLHGTLWLALGLYVSNFTVAYLAIFSAAGTISAEVENGLLLAILPRPIARWRVYFGKWIGYTAWSLIYGAVMFWAVVCIVHALIRFPMDPSSIWKSFGVFELIPMTLVSLSILGSLYLPTLGNGVTVSLLFGIGMIGGFIQRLNQSGAAQDTLNKIGLITSLLIPTNASYYRMLYELMGGSSVAMAQSQVNTQLGPFGGGIVPSNAFLIYTVLYIGVCMGFGVWKFSKKDI